MRDDFLFHKFSVSNYHFGVEGRETKGELRGEQDKVQGKSGGVKVICETGYILRKEKFCVCIACGKTDVKKFLMSNLMKCLWPFTTRNANTVKEILDYRKEKENINIANGNVQSMS